MAQVRSVSPMMLNSQVVGFAAAFPVRARNRATTARRAALRSPYAVGTANVLAPCSSCSEIGWLRLASPSPHNRRSVGFRPLHGRQAW